MSDSSSVGFPEAASRLGVPIRVLRRAIRAGRIAAPERVTAVSTFDAAWLEGVQAAVAASPKILGRISFGKTPAFARYEGTSAWCKYPNRVREYARFRAGAKAS